MKASIYSHNFLIGYAVLTVGDESMGHIYGEFVPNDKYYQHIQKQVWDFNSTPMKDFSKWHSLKFSVQLENGYFLFPVGGYAIEDWQEFPNEAKRIDIAGLDYHIIDDYFHTRPPRVFVDEPWIELTIKDKIEFESELQREIENCGISILGNKFGDIHVLANTEYSALCRSRMSDDVLYIIHSNKSSDGLFAMVHLTWSKNKENADFPITTFFDSFDEFKLRKMYVDKAIWED